MKGVRVGGARQVSWVEEAAWMRAHPGEWKLLTTRAKRAGAYTCASQINHGFLYSFRPAGDFEAERRDTEVWVRFLGDGVA